MWSLFSIVWQNVLQSLSRKSILGRLFRQNLLDALAIGHFNRIHSAMALIVSLGFFLIYPTSVLAANMHEEGTGTGSGIPSFAGLLIALAVMLMAAKMFHVIDRVKQPLVVGELLSGIFLGNLALLGITFMVPYETNPIVLFLAEFGVMLLLFQIGLESNVNELRKAGLLSFLVALVGVVVPVFLGTYVLGPLLFPAQPFVAHLFLGASLAATSVGITARVFKEHGIVQSRAANIVIGAAVIDDVMGLILLALVSSLAIGGEVSAASAGMMTVKSVAFLGGSIVLGILAAPWFSKFFSYISTGTGTKFTVAICFAMLFAAAAQIMGLEPIIGAFAAGLVLDPVHFKFFKDPEIVRSVKDELAPVSKKEKRLVMKALDEYAFHNVEEMIETMTLFFVPIFFVVTGMGVKLAELFSLQSIIIALLISVVAIAGKFVSGLLIKGEEKWIVGLAMVPRGEVGLIFAAVGRSLGVIDDQLYSIIILTVLITTIVGPGLLNVAISKLKYGKSEEVLSNKQMLAFENT